MSASSTASNRLPRWERPSLVRLVAGAGSDKITAVPTETTPSPGVSYGNGS
jgi:hypothetical protein